MVGMVLAVLAGEEAGVASQDRWLGSQVARCCGVSIEVASWELVSKGAACSVAAWSALASSQMPLTAIMMMKSLASRCCKLFADRVGRDVLIPSGYWLVIVLVKRSRT